MRCLYALAVLSLGSCVLLGLAPDSAQACHRRSRGGAVHYDAGPGMYYPPPMPMVPPPPMKPVTIGAYDNYFQPKTAHAAVGAIVRFANYGEHKHTVTAADGSWDSGDIEPGTAVRAIFPRPGVYYYYCRHHTKEKMVGVLVVGMGGGPGGSGGY